MRADILEKLVCDPKMGRAVRKVEGKRFPSPKSVEELACFIRPKVEMSILWVGFPYSHASIPGQVPILLWMLTFCRKAQIVSRKSPQFSSAPCGAERDPRQQWRHPVCQELIVFGCWGMDWLQDSSHACWLDKQPIDVEHKPSIVYIPLAWQPCNFPRLQLSSIFYSRYLGSRV